MGHAHLFQPGDEGENDYHYVADDGSPIIEHKEALRRPLGRILPRPELLGYTLPACEAMLAVWLADDEGSAPASIEAFRDALGSFNWHQADRYVDFDEAIREAYVSALGCGSDLRRDAHLIAWERPIDPYLVLRVLADLPAYADLPVCWNYADVKEGGYVEECSFSPSPPGSRWMVVTEGSSDAFVLKRSLQITHPDISDFF